MKLYNKFLFAFLGGLLLIGCDAENFDQDVEPVGPTDWYPTPSFELQGSPEFTANEILMSRAGFISFVYEFG